MTRDDLLLQREQLMEDIDAIVDSFFIQNYYDDTQQRDELVTQLCDSVCKRIDPCGMA